MHAIISKLEAKQFWNESRNDVPQHDWSEASIYESFFMTVTYLGRWSLLEEDDLQRYSKRRQVTWTLPQPTECPIAFAEHLTRLHFWEIRDYLTSSTFGSPDTWASLAHNSRILYAITPEQLFSRARPGEVTKPAKARFLNHRTREDWCRARELSIPVQRWLDGPNSQSPVNLLFFFSWCRDEMREKRGRVTPFLYVMSWE